MVNELIKVLKCPKCSGNFKIQQIIIKKDNITKYSIKCEGCDISYIILNNFIDFLGK